MPTHIGHDSKGKYYQWGQHGKRYYFNTMRGQIRAYALAKKQGAAAHAHGYQDRP